MSRPDRKASLAAKPELASLEGRRLQTVTPFRATSQAAAGLINLLATRSAMPQAPFVVQAGSSSAPAGVVGAGTPNPAVSQSLARLTPSRVATPFVVAASSTAAGSPGVTSPSRQGLVMNSSKTPTPFVTVAAATTGPNSSLSAAERSLLAHPTSSIGSAVQVVSAPATLKASLLAAWKG